MAIKIDLLPAYVKLRRDLHRSIAASIVVSGLVLGGLLMVLQQRRLELQTAETNLNAAIAVANQTTAANTGRETAIGTAAPLLSAVNFMAGASKTGPQRAALLNQINRYLYGEALISSIDISDGQNVNLRATVKDPNEYARFVLNLRRASDLQGGTLFKGYPATSGPGGFANGAIPYIPPDASNGQSAVPYIYPVSVSATGVLLNPIQLPPDPVGASPAGAPGAPPFAGGGPVGPPTGVPSGPPPGSVPSGAVNPR